ncbi:glc8 protein [Zymoseptoria brevis]|uniref:Glc8 protein n=1 Tax=Zymoseptoria brevis TaxID=1047168 RepID=A0A0F4GKJ3_9PEZI|nr:glc8 protein [Zymoseptoria brevis]
MAQTAPAQTSPTSVPKRPRGILKNSASFQQTSPETRTSPPPVTSAAQANDAPSDTTNRPVMPSRELSEKEITLMNTEMNAGPHRRTSSNPRGSLSRRQSSQSRGDEMAVDNESDGQRLKWDEANLYLNEGQMGGKMKIDEPKTPFAKNYDPAEDEEEISTINAQELAVDELEMNKPQRKGSGSRARESEIPGLDLGEPEMEALTQEESDGERRVHVNSDFANENGGRHGEENTAELSHEEQEKHKKFEEMRKKHYEMKNIKSLLGHPEELDALDDDEEK